MYTHMYTYEQVLEPIHRLFTLLDLYIIVDYTNTNTNNKSIINNSNIIIDSSSMIIDIHIPILII